MATQSIDKDLSPAALRSTGKELGTSPRSVAANSETSRQAFITGRAGSVLNTTKKVGGAVANVGVQLAGTALTAALSAKASSDANKVAQEGLDLQRSMYDEQKKERESKDAEHKASAVKARKMGLLFGETLYNSSSNNQILSGSSNNFSLLSIKRDVT